MDEAELISRARQGDNEAWEALIHQHQEAVFRLVYLLMGDADQAKDVAQEAFIRAFLSLHRFDPSRPVRPWLLQIAANLARNQLRSTSRYLEALRRLVRNTERSDSIERLTAQKLEAESLWQAVRDLSIDDQQIIYLRYFLELPVNETATVLRIPSGTVKSRQHRALEHLRLVIERKHPALHLGQIE